MSSLTLAFDLENVGYANRIFCNIYKIFLSFTLSYLHSTLRICKIVSEDKNSLVRKNEPGFLEADLAMGFI